MLFNRTSICIHFIISRPLTMRNEIKKYNHNLHSKWIQSFLDLYNDRTNFLLLANTKLCGSTNSDILILQKL